MEILCILFLDFENFAQKCNCSFLVHFSLFRLKYNAYLYIILQTETKVMTEKMPCNILFKFNVKEPIKRKRTIWRIFSAYLFLDFVLCQFFEIFPRKISWRSCEFFHLLNIFSNPNIWLRHQCAIKFSGANISSKTLKNLLENCCIVP